MISEKENKNNITLINETTNFIHTIYFEKIGVGNGRHLNFQFILTQNETGSILFGLDSNEIKYSFLNSLDEVWLDVICYYYNNLEEDEDKNKEKENENKKELDNFIKKFYVDTYFVYDKILKVFRCYMSNKNKVLFNKKNFLDDLSKELKIHFFESYKK